MAQDEVRWTPGVGAAQAFARTGPYVAARVGAELVLLTSQQLLNDRSLLLVEPGDDLHVSFFAGGALGAQHRFGDHLFAALKVAATFTAQGRQLDGTFELAWSWY